VRPTRLAREHGAVGPAGGPAKALCIKGFEGKPAAVWHVLGCEPWGEDLLDQGLLKRGDPDGRRAVNATVRIGVEVGGEHHKGSANEELTGQYKFQGAVRRGSLP
jgi:hypothetical protein